MMKRVIIALVGLFAVLGLAVAPASASPTASSDGAESQAVVDVFRAWAGLDYQPAEGTPFPQSVVDPGNPAALCTSLGVTRHSAALIDGAFQVELFAAPEDPEGPRCATEPLATLTAVTRADSGRVTGVVLTRLGSEGATDYIATPIP